MSFSSRSIRSPASARALADHDRDVAGAAARAKEREIAALKAADEFTEACRVIVAGLDLLREGLVAQDREAALRGV
jgi:hypothetical protein